MLRQRHLDENPVNQRIPVESINYRKQLALRGGVGKPDGRAVHPRFVARLALGSNVDSAPRILAHKHDSKSGTNSTRPGESRRSLCYFVANLARNRYAIDQLSGQSPPRVSRGSERP